jgi:hypothetical protein
MTSLTIILCWAICDVLLMSIWAALFELGREHDARTHCRKTLELSPAWYSRVRRFA